MAYAEVSVNSPGAQRRTFSYAIPPGLNIAVGQAVWVPFGNKVLQGVVLEITPQPSVEQVKEIASVIDPLPVLSFPQVLLARWISGHYLSPLFDAVALMLPPGFERKLITYVSCPATPTESQPSSLTPRQKQVLELVSLRGKVSLKELGKALGVKQAQLTSTQLARMGLVVKSYGLERVKVKAKMLPYLRLNMAASNAIAEAASLREQGRARSQARLLEFLAQHSLPVPLADARRGVNCSAAVVNALVAKGWVSIEPTRVKREPIVYQNIVPSQPLTLTPSQKLAFETIKLSLEQMTRGSPTSSPPVFLLHGVTGSGKTEIYLQVLAEAVKLGKRAIVLIPEIALTPQTIEHFAARFPGRVAVLHSRLSPGEQFDEWQRIRDGEFDVVIGPRSAIFAPQPELGLIIIDEEHEWTYKQSDKSPRHHARAVALKLAELVGAIVALGSATPDVESFYRTQTEHYHLLQLPERVTPRVLPEVEVVDLREELKAGNRSLFSHSLAQAMTRAVASGEQVILFLNRRGAATFVQCRHCGFVLRCKRCEVSLTYHSAEDVLACHQCNYRTPVPQLCPRCLSRRIKFLGIGTQKLEQEAGFAFPRARLLRWDSDVIKSKHSHEQILSKFRAHEADILIGTQMIAKGLDLPLVTLVGVVSADTSLNLPDFRAGERTFQLLSQVAGRAGRGSLGGKVIIQSYSPSHYAIQAAAKHDYASFYTEEMAYRRQLHNPPFEQLACLVYSHTNEVLCRREAERMKSLLAQEIDAKGIDNLSIIGPAPAFIHKLRGRFRWQIVLRGVEPAAFLSPMAFPQAWTIDIDPVGLV